MNIEIQDIKTAPAIYVKRRGGLLVEITAEKASELMARARASGKGASELSDIILHDAAGVIIGHVSYNGRVWIHGT